MGRPKFFRHCCQFQKTVEKFQTFDVQIKNSRNDFSFRLLIGTDAVSASLILLGMATRRPSRESGHDVRSGVTGQLLPWGVHPIVRLPLFSYFHPVEIKELLARWQVLLNKTGNPAAMRDVLQERLDILHRLNELGTRDIDGLSIFTAMESTNVSLRGIDMASAA
jgi:hypothetical protein